ncbi:MAG: NAD(+)/NADH kinase, partial [Lachnospiraceae bacterium]|nr:NAD(+)/NADH kinase [Lachnospiraceae bacterium]
MKQADVLKEFLESAGKKCHIAEESFDDPFYRHTNASLIPEDTDCAIVLGGDGTMLHAAHDLCERGIPVLGINMGTFGFLAQTEVSGLESALKTLIDGNYSIEKRLMLSADICCGGNRKSALAVNDVVVTKSRGSRMIALGVFVNDDLVGEYFGDGVIVSTPT